MANPFNLINFQRPQTSALSNELLLSMLSRSSQPKLSGGGRIQSQHPVANQSPLSQALSLAKGLTGLKDLVSPTAAVSAVPQASPGLSQESLSMLSDYIASTPDAMRDPAVVDYIMNQGKSLTTSAPTGLSIAQGGMLGGLAGTGTGYLLDLLTPGGAPKPGALNAALGSIGSGLGAMAATPTLAGLAYAPGVASSMGLGAMGSAWAGPAALAAMPLALWLGGAWDTSADDEAAEARKHYYGTQARTMEPGAYYGYKQGERVPVEWNSVDNPESGNWNGVPIFQTRDVEGVAGGYVTPKNYDPSISYQQNPITGELFATKNNVGMPTPIAQVSYSPTQFEMGVPSYNVNNILPELSLYENPIEGFGEPVVMYKTEFGDYIPQSSIDEINQRYYPGYLYGATPGASATPGNVNLPSYLTEDWGSFPNMMASVLPGMAIGGVANAMSSNPGANASLMQMATQPQSNTYNLLPLLASSKTNQPLGEIKQKSQTQSTSPTFTGDFLGGLGQTAKGLYGAGEAAYDWLSDLFTGSFDL